MLGTLLGGPLGTAGGALVKLIGNQLGLKSEDTTPDNVMALLQADPAAMMKMRELELNNKLELQKLMLEAERIRLADVQSARQRQTESEKATGTRDINMYVLAWMVVAIFFALTGMLLYFSYNGKTVSDSTGVLFMLLGTLSSAFGGVLQYFFGSSKGSADRAKTIDALVDKKE